MSRQLLMSLNGNNRGALYRWLSEFHGEPRVAWYPSAGEDFRDLLYLNNSFSNLKPPKTLEPPCPNFFLHSDYFPWSNSKFLDSKIIYSDTRTYVRLKSIEELPRCIIPLNDQIVDFPKGSHATGRVLFLEVDVDSEQLGTFSAPVIYAFVENGAFCAEKVLPNNGKFSHIIHIRYGGGCGGGGKSSGIWLLNVLQRLECECFVTDSHYHMQSGDEATYEKYPILKEQGSRPLLEPVREISSQSWSGHGDVSWNIVGSV